MCRYESLVAIKVILYNGKVYSITIGSRIRLKLQTNEEKVEFIRFIKSLNGLPEEERIENIRERYRWEIQ